jgi:hypothetical protein
MLTVFSDLLSNIKSEASVQVETLHFYTGIMAVSIDESF